jgi:hypothetical protein
MSRGRALLRAQRNMGLGPLGRPPAFVSCDPEYLRAWRDIVAAAHDVLRSFDAPFAALLAVSLSRWRCGEREESARELYRALGHAFIPMRERRRLLFPERQ